MGNISERWQELHTRFACGETLTEEELAFYHAEEERMDAKEMEEMREANERQIAELEHLRQELLAAKKENQEMQERIERSLQRLAAREAALPKRDKELLGIGG